MLGSSNSIACANIMLNAAVAESLKEFADRLEGQQDFEGTLHELIKETIKKHKRIIFNGNGYDDAWIEEATKVRGLLNLRTTPDCMPALLLKKNVDMLTAHKVFSKAEIESRYEIMMENYGKTVNIEALTMVEMSKKEIMPAVETYIAALAKSAKDKKAVSEKLSLTYDVKKIEKLSGLLEEIDTATADLDDAALKLKAISDVTDYAYAIRDDILPKMAKLRVVCDEAETLTAEKYWPFPTYDELLFGVR